MNLKNTKTIQLPEWINRRIDTQKPYPTDREKMELAVEVSRLNVSEQTGGPFGAAIFNMSDHSLVSVGVNTVVSQNCSICHAEINAILMAQEKLHTYRLDLTDDQFALFSSAQPCAMCYASIIWAGIKKLVYAATREDVMNILGFDEGPLPEDWKKEYADRNIEVAPPLLSDSAVEVLLQYKKEQGVIY